MRLFVFLFSILFSALSGVFIFFLPELKDFFLLHNDILLKIEGFGIYPVVILCILFSLISIIMKNSKFTSIFIFIGLISYYLNFLDITMEENILIFHFFLLTVFFVRYIVRIPSKIAAFFIPIVFVIGETGLIFYYKEKLIEYSQSVLINTVNFFISVSETYISYINPVFIYLSGIIFIAVLFLFNRRQSNVFNLFISNSIITLGITLTVFKFKEINVLSRSFFYNVSTIVMLLHTFVSSLSCSQDHYTGKYLEKKRKKVDKIRQKEKEKEELNKQNIVISPEVLLIDFEFIRSTDSNIVYHVPIRIIDMLQSVKDMELRNNVSQAVNFLKNYKGINLKFSTATRSIIPPELDTESEEGAVFAICMKLSKLGQKAKILTADMPKHKIAANYDLELVLFSDYL